MKLAKGMVTDHGGDAQTIGTEGGIRGGKRELRDACCVRCGGQSTHLILMELASMADSVNVLLIHVGTAGWTGPSCSPAPARLGGSAGVDAELSMSAKQRDISAAALGEQAAVASCCI